MLNPLCRAANAVLQRPQIQARDLVGRRSPGHGRFCPSQWTCPGGYSLFVPDLGLRKVRIVVGDSELTTNVVQT